MKLKKPLVLHPFLLAAFPCLFLYFKNRGELFLHEMLISLILMQVICFGLLIFLRLFLKSWLKIGLVASCVITCTFAYSNFNSIFLSSWGLSDKLYIARLSFWFILLALAIFIISRLKQLENWTKILNFTAGLLVVMSPIKNLTHFPDSKQQISQVNNSGAQAQNPERQKNILIDNLAINSNTTTNAQTETPNIYYLIFDGHVGHEFLTSLGYDNSGFVDALKKRGFFVGKKSVSNYVLTRLSLRSSLNCSYLVPFRNKPDEWRGSQSLVDALKNNYVFRFLKKLDYTTIQCSATSNVKLKIGPSDLDLLFDIKQVSPPWYANRIFLELLSNTPVLDVVSLFTGQRSKVDIGNILHRRCQLLALDAIKETASYEEPIVLFAHIMVPHLPFVFDENGDYPSYHENFVWTAPQVLIEKYQKAIGLYLAQMEYIDKRILEIIDFLQKNSKTPPVIILQGDHGVRYHINFLKDQTISPETARESFSILNAYCLPGYDHSNLPDSITPVNTFRIIFNQYFGTEHELLPDRSYFSPQRNDFDFIDVSEYLKTPDDNTQND